jgi:hypothetical protein
MRELDRSVWQFAMEHIGLQHKDASSLHSHAVLPNQSYCLGSKRSEAKRYSLLSLAILPSPQSPTPRRHQLAWMRTLSRRKATARRVGHRFHAARTSLVCGRRLAVVRSTASVNFRLRLAMIPTEIQASNFG